MTYVTIDDDRFKFAFADDSGKVHRVTIGNLLEGGTPIDEDSGNDMSFLGTQVRTPDLCDTERLQTILLSAKPQDMFYVPESKEDFNKWIKAMPAEMPTGVAVMVGYNYAMQQVRMLADGTHPNYQEGNADG